MKQKLLKTMRGLLVAVLLGVGVNGAWGQVSTWTFSSTNANNTYGAEFEGSKSGIVKVQLGATSEANGWAVFHYGSYDRGVYYTVDGVGQGVTLSTEAGQEAIPVSGTFMTVKPQFNMTFAVKVYNDKPNGVESKQYVYIANASNPSTKTQSQWRVNSPGESTQTYNLTKDETYYIYMGSSSYGFASFTAKTESYNKLESEIAAATTLKSTDGYNEGQDDLQSAISTAQGVLDNSSSTDANYVAAMQTLVVAEELFTALNTKNTTYAVSASSLMSDGTVSKIVYGMTMAYHGTWGYEYNSGRFGHAARALSNYNSDVTDNIPTGGDYIEFVPNISGNLQIKGMFYGGHTDAVLVNGSTKAIVKEYSNKNNDWSYVDFGYLIAGTTYYFYSKSKGDWGNGLSAFIYTTSVSGTITDCGWSTFASPYALDLSTISGGTAYYASEASGSTVTLTTTDATVPAGEGIMVKGTADETFTINVAASGTAISGNLLKGQTTTGDVAASGTDGKYHYVFGINKTDASVYGFYNLTADTEVPAGKAYLETTTELTANARIAIVFGDEASGIAEIEEMRNVENENVYNLSGQRISQPTRGLYIVNGRKVLVK